MEAAERSMANRVTPEEILREYSDLLDRISRNGFSSSKKRKTCEHRIRALEEEYRFLVAETSASKVNEVRREKCEQCRVQETRLLRFFDNQVEQVLQTLQRRGFLQVVGDNAAVGSTLIHATLQLTPVGAVAVNIREVHCLVFSQLYVSGRLRECSARQLAALFGCFAPIRVPDINRDATPRTQHKALASLVQWVHEQYVEYQEEEAQTHLDTGVEYDIQFDLIPYMEQWCESTTAERCAEIVQDLGRTRQVFLGDFIKALLKIGNICNEFEKVAEIAGDIAFLHTLQEVSVLTLKYVATNQSLYL